MALIRIFYIILAKEYVDDGNKIPNISLEKQNILFDIMYSFILNKDIIN